MALRPLLLGVDAVLVECADQDEVLALHAAALERVRGGLAVRDLVPAARTVLFDGVADPSGLVEDVVGWSLGGGEATAGDLVELPTTYDGEDLADVAERWGMTAAEVVSTHTATEFRVAFCGFAPGFGYCVGLPEELAVPRLDRPRARIPAGAVGLAGAFTGAYPRSSPGGWRLIGRTDAPLWDETRDPPALLTPGTRVRFVDVGRG